MSRYHITCGSTRSLRSLGPQKVSRLLHSQKPRVFPLPLILGVRRHGEVLMNWEAAGAIGEIFGAATVAITLIVLIIQLRQNTTEVRAATEQSLHEKSIELFGESMMSDLPGILAKNRQNKPLTDEERERYILFIRRNLQLFELVFQQHQQGRLSDEIMNAYNVRMKSHLEFRDWEDIWSLIKPLMTLSFQTHMEALR